MNCTLYVAIAITALTTPSREIQGLPGPEKEPTYVAKPKYACLLVGEKHDKPMWIVLDRTGKGKHIQPYDVAYVDFNGNLDLTEKNERVDISSFKNQRDFTDPFSGVKHTGFRITGPIINTVSDSLPQELQTTLEWMGNVVHIYFNHRGVYKINASAVLTDSARTAHAFSVNLGAPLEINGNRFGRRFDGELKIGDEPEKLYLGTGTSWHPRDVARPFAGWTIVHDNKFDVFPETDHLVATLFYTDKHGEPARHVVKLQERC